MRISPLLRAGLRIIDATQTAPLPPWLKEFLKTMSITSDLAALFSRDLAKLGKQVEAFPSDEALWQTLPGVKNSAGNLALHIE